MNFLNGVAAISANDVWAVGQYQNPSVQHFNTLTMHWNGTDWTVVSSPNRYPPLNNVLSSVSAIAANDIWGRGALQLVGVVNTMVMHWDGQGWGLRSSPNPGLKINYLNAVTAVSSNEVWAVGTYQITSTMSLKRWYCVGTGLRGHISQVPTWSRKTAGCTGLTR